MDTLKFFFALILVWSASLKAEEIRVRKEGPWVKWSKETTTGLRYLCENGDCVLPKRLSADKLKTIQWEWERGGTNPSALLCKKLDGVVGIATLKSGDEISVCQFDEKVWIHSWDLHNFWKRSQ